MYRRELMKLACGGCLAEGAFSQKLFASSQIKKEAPEMEEVLQKIWLAQPDRLHEIVGISPVGFWFQTPDATMIAFEPFSGLKFWENICYRA